MVCGGGRETAVPLGGHHVLQDVPREHLCDGNKGNVCICRDEVWRDDRVWWRRNPTRPCCVHTLFAVTTLAANHLLEHAQLGLIHLRHADVALHPGGDISLD